MPYRATQLPPNALVKRHVVYARDVKQSVVPYRATQFATKRSCQTNAQVDRLVRRADIFEVTNSPGRAPQGSMEREDKSCAGGGGVDAARYGPGDLRSRQKKKRKLERSEGSPLRSPDTPDTQPVWEERTPARPALFQARTPAAAIH